ncbi:hypothetical protein [Thermococcus sp.]
MDSKMRAIIAILIGILIPLSTAAWSMALTSNTTSTATLPTNSSTMTNTSVSVNVSLQIQAYNLLVIVDGVANYTSTLIANLEASNVTIPTSILANYTEAEDLRTQAWSYYSAGFYNKSIETSLLALEAYKGIVQSLTAYISAGPTNNTYATLIAEAKAALHRGASYFPYAEKVIIKAQKDGLNVTVVQSLYGQTKEAYMKLAEDIANGDYTNLEADLKNSEELMDKLQEEIQELNNAIANVEAEKIARAFMKKLEEQMMATEHLMMQLGNSSEELSMLNKNLAQLQLIYSQLEEMVKNGEYNKALQIMEDANKKLKSVVESNKEVRKEVEKGKGHKGKHWEENNQTAPMQNQTNTTSTSENNMTTSTSNTTTGTMPGNEENTSENNHNPTPPSGGHKG